MPQRLIRDGLLESEAVLSLPVEARWLYVSILLSADDVGLFEAAPFRLARRADVRREMADKLVSMLVDADLVRLYQVDGKRFGFVPKFGQRLQLRRMKYPAPPAALMADDAEALKKINDLGSRSTVNNGESRFRNGNSPSESESESEAKEKNIRAERVRPTAAPDGFAEFWSAWPNTERKANKKGCAAIWQKKKLADEAAEILANVESLKLTKKWVDGFEPAPATYLNQERWKDGGSVLGSLTQGFI